MTATVFTTTHAPAAFQAGWDMGVEDAQNGAAPLFTYPADLPLYAHFEFVSAYVDGYESVKGL